ncbi:MAG: trigger factor [Candidatus Omnitrophica bacterium]|nr:trigger factor [Candidatus Omnitrophota bacterium]
MKSRVKPVEECSTLFEIEVSRETIARAFDEVYDEITKVANIPGFRVGKAPKDMVRLHYAKDAKEEVLKRLVPDAYRKALQEHGIIPVSMPEISDLVFEEDKPITFKARVDTRPKFKLKPYKGLALTRKVLKITDEDIDKTLKSLQGVNAKYISAGDRPVQMGDYVVSDVECFVDGKPAHKKRENLWLTMEKETFIPGLADKMVGMKKGEEKDIEAKLHENYPDKNLAGKDARYHIAVKEIKERKLPAIDDEFAKDLGRENLEDLKKEVLKELEARSKASGEADLENQLLGKLMDDNVFQVPSGFVARQLKHMVDDAKRRLLERGFNKEELDKKDKEFSDKFRDDAVRQVRLIFILDEIADKEKVEVSDEDVVNAYKAVSLQSGKPEAEIKAYYEKEGLVESLKEKIREGKTVKFLLDNSTVTDKG